MALDALEPEGGVTTAETTRDLLNWLTVRAKASGDINAVIAGAAVALATFVYAHRPRGAGMDDAIEVLAIATHHAMTVAADAERSLMQ